MSHEDDLRALWLSIDDVVIELAHVRDSYASLEGEDRKAALLTGAHLRLQRVEEALHDYINNNRRPNEAADHLALFMSQAAVDYAKSMIEWAHEALQEGSME